MNDEKDQVELVLKRTMQLVDRQESLINKIEGIVEDLTKKNRKYESALRMISCMMCGDASALAEKVLE